MIAIFCVKRDVSDLFRLGFVGTFINDNILGANNFLSFCIAKITNSGCEVIIASSLIF